MHLCLEAQTPKFSCEWHVCDISKRVYVVAFSRTASTNCTKLYIIVLMIQGGKNKKSQYLDMVFVFIYIFICTLQNKDL